MNDFLEQQLPAIITGILGLGAWLFEKRKKNAELSRVESDANQAMQTAYRNFVADMNIKYEELKAEVTILKGDNYEMKAQVEILKSEVVEWKSKYESLQSKYESLQSEMNRMENGVQTTPNNGKQ